ncbi:MAG: uroporphyrinogen decarboxylase family protein [Kiritimatiellae bacterium]|nr:uroporphyrinogen decarboxylase family protein [Kiritimatiellia bacterium]MDD5521420.1 uroporphyrinogen decarboxylase family protein [Kiritimatiellia bacterium]
MKRRERIMATLRGEPVDRPPVSFYELNGLDENPDDPDPFNIYTHPSWLPLIELAREKTDRIVMRGATFKGVLPDPAESLTTIETSVKNGSQFTTKTIKIGAKTLRSRTRRDADVNTVWTEEHLLKDVDDLRLFLEIPQQEFAGSPDLNGVLLAEQKLGDTGIVMIDTPDPLCLAASLFDMATYTIIAMTEPDLFNQLLERYALLLLPATQSVARSLPGRLWRIYGPEYAAPPYLPPNLFREYVVRYDKPMVNAIHRDGGFARIHSHGKLKAILDDIVSIGVVALDPIEPPPQGDVELKYVREKYGKHLVLFGNLEVSDIETLSSDLFAEKIKRAIDEGTTGDGRGFVLMPSASPYGRNLSRQTLKNYCKIIEIVETL